MKIITQKGIEVDLGKDIQMVIEETEVIVIVGQGWDQEQGQIDIGLGVINVENMITLQKIVPQLKRKER